eukprot:1737845-Amphidinium_carterae.1
MVHMLDNPGGKLLAPPAPQECAVAVASPACSSPGQPSPPVAASAHPCLPAQQPPWPPSPWNELFTTMTATRKNTQTLVINC